MIMNYEKPKTSAQARFKDGKMVDFKLERFCCDTKMKYIDHGKWYCEKCGKYINKSGKLKV